MTTKRIKLDYGTAERREFEEIEEEDLTSREALRLWTKYSNKYALPTWTHLHQGQNSIMVSLSRKDAKALLLSEDPTQYRNCETSSRWYVRVTSSYISIRATDFQDFSKTKENNWGSLE